MTPTRTTRQEQLDNLLLAEALTDALLLATGQSKPSREGRRKALNICQRLLNGDANVNGEGYTEEEIRAGIQIAAERGARSPKYLEHIIGEAAGKLERIQRKTARDRVLDLQLEAEEARRKDAYEASLARLEQLPAEKYEALRERALERLGGRKLPEPAIKGLMIGLMERGM